MLAEIQLDIRRINAPLQFRNCFVPFENRKHRHRWISDNVIHAMFSESFYAEEVSRLEYNVDYVDR
jgi:hypothetical protein